MSERWRVILLHAEFAIVVALVLIGIASFVYGTAAQAKRPPIVAAGVAFICTPVAVWDGDGPVWCAEGPRLRLAGVAARELDNSCRPHSPCPAASGIAARDQLVQLLGGTKGRTGDGHILVAGPPMPCRSRGPDRYQRTLASCLLTGQDLGKLLISRGVALPWR